MTPKKQPTPLNGLSRSLTPFDPNETLTVVVGMSTEGVAPRTELIMYAQQPQGWMFSVLKGLAEMPFEYATCLHWGHTVPNGMPMTAKPSELTSFFFVPTRDEPPELAKLSIGRDRGDFLVLVPITESERAYAREHSSAALVTLMDGSGFRLAVDEGRNSLV